MTETLLIIEDEELLGQEMVSYFRRTGWEVKRAATIQEARDVLLSGTFQPEVVLSDMNLPDGNALDLLDDLRQAGRGGEWVFLTGYGSVPDSVRALRLGAHDFLEKPASMDRLGLVVSGAARAARAQRRLMEEASRQNRRYAPEAFLGSSTAAEAVRSMLRQLSQVPLSALVIGGETGVGKGLVARILHHGGVRSAGPMVEVNCAALPRELMESELFGHEAGAFTGARGRHRGLFEQAQGGTLFLDEVSELAPGLQAKLLKAVEDRSIRRVGGEKEIPVDVQVFAASNQDLARLVREGTFRQDLYHRLSVFRIQIPPLRERPQDLDQLVPAFVAEANALAGKRVTEISLSVWSRLKGYSWPGNVRELRNVIERSVLLANSRTLPLQWLQLPGEAETFALPAGSGAAPGSGSPEEGSDVVPIHLDGSQTLDEMEARIIRAALDRHGHNVSAAAKALGTTRQTLRYRIEKHGIEGGK